MAFTLATPTEWDTHPEVLFAVIYLETDIQPTPSIYRIALGISLIPCHPGITTALFV
jgi:hypothetical protein